MNRRKTCCLQFYEVGLETTLEQREQIPPLFGLQFTQGAWRQGFIRKESNIFLLVTLEKTGMPDTFQYEDGFLSTTEFQWQSQTQTTQGGPAGLAIRNHEAEGTKVHLFVRSKKLLGGKAAPFYYCGQLRFVSWEGDSPISVKWSLIHEVPDFLRSPLGVE